MNASDSARAMPSDVNEAAAEEGCRGNVRSGAAEGGLGSPPEAAAAAAPVPTAADDVAPKTAMSVL